MATKTEKPSVFQLLRESSHRKLTFLIIPHHRKNTLQFQTSFLSLFFLGTLVLALLVTAGTSIWRDQKTQRKLNELSTIYGIFVEYYLSSSEELREIQENFGRIQENLLETFQLLDGEDDELRKLPSEKEIFALVQSSLQKEEEEDPALHFGGKYFAEVYETRALLLRMTYHRSLLDANAESIFRLDSFFQEVPERKPLEIFNLTSGFGIRRSPTTGSWENHEGLDLANAPGTPIRAAAKGIVSKIVYSRVGYGYHLIIDHNFGYSTLYGHCDRILVRLGQEVEAGEIVAEVGATGNVTGPHLHYEIWSGEGNKLDPEEYLNSGFF